MEALPAKKNNAKEHLKSNMHAKAALRLKNKNGGTEAEKVAAATTSQKTIIKYSQDINKSQKLPLTKKFQLVHFLTVHNKSFHFYQELAHFEKDYHNVQLGSGYLSKDAAQEILQYILNSILEEKVTLLLNPGKRCYFSLLLMDLHLPKLWMTKRFTL